MLNENECRNTSNTGTLNLVPWTCLIEDGIKKSNTGTLNPIPWILKKDSVGLKIMNGNCCSAVVEMLCCVGMNVTVEARLIQRLRKRYC